MHAVTAQQYAKGLFETLEEASASQIDSVVENFIRLLASQRDLRKIPEVLRILDRLYAASGKSFDVLLVTAKEISQKTLSDFSTELKKHLPDVRLEHTVDPSLQAGAVVRVNDVLYDGSLRTILKNLFYKLVS